MINKLSHATIYVEDQDTAIDFYVNKLGLEIRTDAKMDNGFRWVTVGGKDQPDLEIVLMPIRSVMSKEEIASQLENVIKSGGMSGGVFHTTDIHKSYEELKAKGVEFMQPPAERFYGIEALFKDPFGNWFSLTQHNM